MKKKKSNNSNEKEINLINKKRKRIKKNEQMFIFSKNIVSDSFIELGTDNTFCAFKATNNIFYIVYPNKNYSLIMFDIINDKKISEIKDAHKGPITIIEHIISVEYGTIKKKDLIMSMSSKENNIKIWNLDFGCLLNLEKNNKNIYLNVTCFLNNIYNDILIVRSGNKNMPIKIYDLEGILIKDINNSNFSINVLCSFKKKIKYKIKKKTIIVIKIIFVIINKIKKYYNKNKSLDKENNKKDSFISSKNIDIKNINMNASKINNDIISNNKQKYKFKFYDNTYIIAVNNNEIRSYDYDSNTLYNIYTTNIKQRINSICINENEEANITKLIGVCDKGYILIWDFDNSTLINQIQVYNGNLYGICILNNEYLCFGHNKNINIINLNDKEINILKPNHNKTVISIQKINHPILGECLISQGDNTSNIKLWIKKND